MNKKKKNVYTGSWQEAYDKLPCATPRDPWEGAAEIIREEIDAEIIADLKELAAVDPEWETLYGQLTNNGETALRSISMSDDFLLDDDEFDLGVDDVEEETGLTVEDFLVRLETFLESEFDEDARGNVFLSDNGDNGVVLNILVGASFQETDSEINQVNIIVSPTDRTFLGAEGVSMDDREDTDDPNFDEDEVSPFDEAMSVLGDE